jgi:hypothetical protein
VGPTDELHEAKDASHPPERPDVIGDKVAHPAEEAATEMEKANALIGESETPIPAPTNEKVAETPPKRSWWRRLPG